MAEVRYNSVSCVNLWIFEKDDVKCHKLNKFMKRGRCHYCWYIASSEVFSYYIMTLFPICVTLQLIDLSVTPHSSKYVHPRAVSNVTFFFLFRSIFMFSSMPVITGWILNRTKDESLYNKTSNSKSEPVNEFECLFKVIPTAQPLPVWKPSLKGGGYRPL